MFIKFNDTDNNLRIRNMFLEDESGVMKLGYDVDNLVFSTTTKSGQCIEIFDSKAWGRTLVIDGMVQNSVETEMFYNEMMVHMALDCLPTPKDVLIIGGGSGLTCRQCLKYTDVKRITLCDISYEIIKLSEQYFPKYYTSALSDERVKVVIADGCEFIKGERFLDAILVDCCDPIGCAERLYEDSFYEDCISALTPNGVLCVQVGAPLFENGKCEYDRLHSYLKCRMDITYIDVLFTCPMIVGGFYMFTLISKDIGKNWDKSYHILETDCKYYNPNLRKYYMTIPNFIIDRLVTRNVVRC